MFNFYMSVTGLCMFLAVSTGNRVHVPDYPLWPLACSVSWSIFLDSRLPWPLSDGTAYYFILAYLV